MASMKSWGSWLILGAGSIGIGFGTVIMTDTLRLDPCHLCIFQRLLMLIFGGLAIGAGLSARNRPTSLALGTLALLTAVGGAATAIYQSWIQLQPTGAISCVGAQPGTIEIFVEWLGELAPSLFLATGFCEDDAFKLLGLSLANWSLVSFCLLAVATAWTIRQSLRPTTGRSTSIEHSRA
ncbi:disulfide bond formation protein B [Thiorhodococcus mannitoliphagus]|uniref:Disulfide bond formation protein B n=1 Tax=Thiorhodococcus mannitoliphagus TaxID=329406 RepID=A0A6P1DUE5_9GAMM|nr:disulfide bond formation protein B [Thiorhodococcus mannitoliphagus]NEX20316.1 disulfide bond formation protein B [Thiorhodococcus mannitoliphagus]